MLDSNILKVISLSKSYLPGSFSTFVISLAEYLKLPNQPNAVIGVGRVSTSRQDQQGNLQKQEDVQEKYLEGAGMDMEHWFEDIGSGRINGWFYREGMLKAIEMARSTGLPLMVTDCSRLLRDKGYHIIHNRAAWPNNREMTFIRKKLEGIIVISICPPEADHKQITQFQITNGLARGKSNNRNLGMKEQKYDKPLRNKLIPEAKRMQKAGCSLREIGEALGISHTAISKWLKSYKGSKDGPSCARPNRKVNAEAKAKRLESEGMRLFEMDKVGMIKCSGGVQVLLTEAS